MSKKGQLQTAYQRHIDILKVLGIVLLVGPAVTAGVVIWAANRSNGGDYGTTQAFLIYASVLGFLLGIVCSVAASMKQNVADAIGDRLYAVWRCKPDSIYRFYRKQCRYEKKTAFWSFTVLAILICIPGFMLRSSDNFRPIGTVAIIVAGCIFVYALCTLPYLRYWSLKLRTLLYGDAKEIIFSRNGIWYCGKVYYFGNRHITYHRVERKEIHGLDAIVFSFTTTHGFQQTAQDLAIPVPQKMAYAADELVQEFNRSDLLEKTPHSDFFKTQQ